MNSITLRAYGKVNLALDVTGRRGDGYHYVRMVLQAVDVYDEVKVSFEDDDPDPDPLPEREADESSIADDRPKDRKIYISCSRPFVPLDESNLAYKAADKMFKKYGIKKKCHIHIEKNIPMAAGMAGGSADCAAVIMAVNRLAALDLDQKTLDVIATELGADVPFCLRNISDAEEVSLHKTELKACLAEGIGEKLTLIKGLTNCYLFMAKPDFDISTPEVYKKLDSYPEIYDRAELSAQKGKIHPDIDGLIQGLASADIKKAALCVKNIRTDRSGRSQ